jgi:diacylglycerol kinase (ATP)
VYAPGARAAQIGPRPSFVTWLIGRVASFRFAFQGIFHLIRTQHNAHIHLVLGAIAITLGIILGIGQAEWLALTIIITLVLATEGVNTAIEAVVDLASPERHPLAKIAKDVAAGTVLLTAIGAIIVGCIIFIPPLWALAQQFLAGS